MPPTDDVSYDPSTPVDSLPHTEERTHWRGGDVEAVPEGTVDVVTAWIGDDPTRAEAARAAELSSDSGGRKGVLEHADSVIETARAEAEAAAAAGDGDGDGGPVVENADGDTPPQ